MQRGGVSTKVSAPLVVVPIAPHLVRKRNEKEIKMLKSTIIRVLAFAALFAYIVPTAFSLTGFGASFAFSGSIFAALGVGVVYMAAMFGVLGIIGLASAPFKLTVEKRRSLAPLWGTIFYVATMLCLLGAHSLLPFLGLSVVGLLPAMIGAGIAFGVMHFTMPSGSADASSKSAS